MAFCALRCFNVMNRQRQYRIPFEKVLETENPTQHGAECVVLHIGNKNGALLVKGLRFFTKGLRFFTKGLRQ